MAGTSWCLMINLATAGISKCCGVTRDLKGLRPWWVGCVTSILFKVDSSIVAATKNLKIRHFLYVCVCVFVCLCFHFNYYVKI